MTEIHSLVAQFFERDGLIDVYSRAEEHPTLIGDKAMEKLVLALHRAQEMGVIPEEFELEEVVWDWVQRATMYYTQYAVIQLVMRGDVIPMSSDGRIWTFISTDSAEELLGAVPELADIKMDADDYAEIEAELEAHKERLRDES